MKNNFQFKFTKVILLFSMCIIVRIFLVILAKNINTKYLPILGYLALIPAFGFLYRYLSGTRKTGILGQPSWWNNLRPIHALLYLLFAIYAINKSDKSYILLLIDVIIGIMAFIIYHFIL
jgi:hypothetical protein